MKNQDIVLINMSSYSEWDRGVSNRNFHIMNELEKNPDIRKIICVDYPPLTFRRAVRNYRDNLLVTLKRGTVVKSHPLGKVVKLSDRLYVYSFVDFFWRPEKFTDRLNKVLQELNFEDYLLWSFFPPFMPYAGKLKPKLKIFDAVDNWAEHSSYKKLGGRLNNNYHYIKDNCDIIFTVAEDLQNLFENQPNVYWIPNGVDLKHYQQDLKLINRDISDLPRPIIGYIGVIQDRVDFELISYLAKDHPQKSFVLVGPIWYAEAIKKLSELPNVHLLGYKEYSESPIYVKQFDVGLIPHKQNDFITSTNPMKMYEYLACGKPVVATANAGAEMFQDDVYIAKDYAEFSHKIDQALAEDSAEKQARRQTMMEKYSWSKTVKEMIALIEKKMNY